MNRVFITPQQLAKRTKETARTVSLRIKEKTWLGFEQLAKDNNTTANALISELADYYIESLDSNSLDLSEEAVLFNRYKTFLEKEVRKLCRWSIDDAVIHINPAYAHDKTEDDKFRYSHLFSLKKIYKKMCTFKDGQEYSNPEFEFGIYLEKDITVQPTLKTEASYEVHSFDPANPAQNILNIPLEKAPDTISLLSIINDYIKDNMLYIVFDIETMDKIVDMINSHDYKYVETNYADKPPVIKYDEDERKAMLHGLSQIIFESTGAI